MINRFKFTNHTINISIILFGSGTLTVLSGIVIDKP